MNLKRLFEIVFSGTAILFLSPILLLIAVALKVESRGPSLYKTIRMGSNNKVFTAVKFRTIYLSAGKSYEPNTRITRVGDFLRKTSLDELPQLYNVLNGEMSLFFPSDLKRDSKSLITETTNRAKIITFLRSLKFLIPKKLLSGPQA